MNPPTIYDGKVCWWSRPKWVYFSYLRDGTIKSQVIIGVRSAVLAYGKKFAKNLVLEAERNNVDTKASH